MEGIVYDGRDWVAVAVSGLELGGGVEELIGEADLAALADQSAVEGEALVGTWLAVGDR